MNDESASKHGAAHFADRWGTHPRCSAASQLYCCDLSYRHRTYWNSRYWRFPHSLIGEPCAMRCGSSVSGAPRAEIRSEIPRDLHWRRQVHDIRSAMSASAHPLGIPAHEAIAEMAMRSGGITGAHARQMGLSALCAGHTHLVPGIDPTRGVRRDREDKGGISTHPRAMPATSLQPVWPAPMIRQDSGDRNRHIRLMSKGAPVRVLS